MHEMSGENGSIYEVCSGSYNDTNNNFITNPTV